LAAHGESALPCLISRITDASSEASIRAVALIGKPRDPALRAEAAARMLASEDPDWMERAVHMLFEAPAAYCDAFEQHARQAPVSRRVVFDTVLEQLRASRQRWLTFETRYQRLRREKPEQAERERKMQTDTNLYEAEAAYWSALDALAEEPAKHRSPAPPTSGHPR